jgi:hypothetical protein
MIGRRINNSLLTRFMHTYAFFFFAANAVVLSRVLVQCRLIPYLHQKPIFFKANSIHSSIVAILELIRGAQCLIEVIRSSGQEM